MISGRDGGETAWLAGREGAGRGGGRGRWGLKGAGGVSCSNSRIIITGPGDPATQGFTQRDGGGREGGERETSWILPSLHPQRVTSGRNENDRISGVTAERRVPNRQTERCVLRCVEPGEREPLCGPGPANGLIR